MTSPMSCEIHEPDNGVVLLVLRGEATVSHARALHADLLRLANPQLSLAIDATDGTRVDAAILQLLQSAKSAFASVRLRAASPGWDRSCRRLGWPQPWS